MFTGIIEGFGIVKGLRKNGKGARITIESEFPLDDTKIGDSIAVNGTCLTPTTLTGRLFEADAAPETLSRTVIGDLKPGDKVNLERAMKATGRLDGHIVSGHVDGTGIIREKKVLSNAIVVRIEVPPELAYYMIEKGSVAIDGISLTINACTRNDMELSIIPHTESLTSIGFKKTGDRVNIETDVIGKYVERFTQVTKEEFTGKAAGPSGGVSLGLLAEKGFL